MKKVFSLFLALSLFLSACGAGADEAPAPSNIVTAQVGNLSGTFQKPVGCNDPCQSILASFVATTEGDLAPTWYVNWGDGSPEEQLLEGTHTYPPGPSHTYNITLTGKVASGIATWSVRLETPVTIPLVQPVVIEEEVVPPEGQ